MFHAFALGATLVTAAYVAPGAQARLAPVIAVLPFAVPVGTRPAFLAPFVLLGLFLAAPTRLLARAALAAPDNSHEKACRQGAHL